jgi:hypothetical protein
MTASPIGDARVHRWVTPYRDGTHQTVLKTVTWVILCLLVAQGLQPAALVRAIPTEEAGAGRSCLRRVQRWWHGPAIPLALLLPRLLRAALALLPQEVAIVALDTTRVGPWEIWSAGVVFAGHTVPVAWAVRPSPWPKGGFRATTLALVRQLQAAFPPGRQGVFVADRGFPRAQLVGQWDAQPPAAPAPHPRYGAAPRAPAAAPAACALAPPPGPSAPPRRRSPPAWSGAAPSSPPRAHR